MADLRVLIQCARCRQPFHLPIGPNLMDMCATCRKISGRNLTESRQTQMNFNHHFLRDRIEHTTNPFARHCGTRPFTFLGRHFIKKLLT